MAKKWMLLGGGVLVALAAVGLFTVFSNLSRILSAAIEKHGSEATGTSVSVSGVDVSLRDGKGGIEGLRIGSPEGYKAHDAFRLGGLSIDLDVQSVREDPVVIERLEVATPEIFAEFQKDGSSNLAEIRKHLESFAPSKGEASDGKGGGGKSKRIRIDEFVFAEGQIAIDATALGLEARTIKLPSIRLQNVGGADGGTPPELAKEILTTLVSRATSEVGRSEISRQLRGLTGDSVDKAKQLLDRFKN